ncbi:TlpA family protein disulfide reductase [Flavobacterium sp. RHBU_3]|uniref:TlpA family protein disulfide reductase n=1 Tax=Flavobacterium sp. RHBU_3 TaxID=3391184 RepID=UPI003984C84E
MKPVLKHLLWIVPLAVFILFFMSIVTSDTVGFFNKINNTEYTLADTKFKLVKTDGTDTIVDLKGDKAKFFHFWGTFCKPCIAEKDSIEKYRKHFGAVDFYMVSPESPEKVRKFMENRKLNMPVYCADTTQFPFKEKGIRFFPTSVVIQHDSVAETAVGSMEWSAVKF